MHFEISLDRQDEIVVVRSHGRFSAAAMHALCDDLAGLEAYRAGLPILNDMRGVDFQVPTTEVYQATHAPILQPRCALRRAGAMLVKSPLGFGMARIYCQLRERPWAVFNVAAFEDDARDWLAGEIRRQAQVPPPARTDDCGSCPLSGQGCPWHGTASAATAPSLAR